MLGMIHLAVVAFVSGWISGHNWTWAKSANDVSLMACFRSAADGLDFRSKFLTRDCRAEWQAEFVIGGKTYDIVMTKAEEF